MARIIITGTSRGIGFELAKILAADGHQVLALSRNDQRVAELENPNIDSFAFDIAKKEDWDRVKEFIEEKWQTVDVLINNAGKLLNTSFLETSMEDLRDVYEVNIIGVFGLLQKVLPFMESGGHVVNISSMGGIQGSMKFPGLAAYSSSKGALITLTELMAEEFKETGPSFNVLALGAVQTEMLEEAFPGYKAPVTALEMATYISNFALKGHHFYNGKVMQVSKTTP